MHVFPVLDPSQVRDPRELVRWLVEFFGFFFGQTWERKNKKHRKTPGSFWCVFFAKSVGNHRQKFFLFFL